MKALVFSAPEPPRSPDRAGVHLNTLRHHRDLLGRCECGYAHDLRGGGLLHHIARAIRGSRAIRISTRQWRATRRSANSTGIINVNGGGGADTVNITYAGNLTAGALNVPTGSVILVSTAGSMTINSGINVGSGDVRLQAASNIVQAAGGVITAGALGARGTAGNIDLDAASNAVVCSLPRLSLSTHSSSFTTRPASSTGQVLPRATSPNGNRCHTQRRPDHAFQRHGRSHDRHARRRRLGAQHRVWRAISCGCSPPPQRPPDDRGDDQKRPARRPSGRNSRARSRQRQRRPHHLRSGPRGLRGCGRRDDIGRRRLRPVHFPYRRRRQRQNDIRLTVGGNLLLNDAVGGVASINAGTADAVIVAGAVSIRSMRTTTLLPATRHSRQGDVTLSSGNNDVDFLGESSGAGNDFAFKNVAALSRA